MLWKEYSVTYRSTVINKHHHHWIWMTWNNIQYIWLCSNNNCRLKCSTQHYAIQVNRRGKNTLRHRFWNKHVVFPLSLRFKTDVVYVAALFCHKFVRSGRCIQLHKDINPFLKRPNYHLPPTHNWPFESQWEMRRRGDLRKGSSK